MDSMIERVSSAVAPANFRSDSYVAGGRKTPLRVTHLPTGHVTESREGESSESVYNRATARAAIAAMREPAEAMVERGRLQTAGDFDDGRSMAIACWEEMIDSALKEGE